MRMSKLIIHEDDVDHSYECANGFVQRCVSAVHDVNYADARKLAKIMNEYYRDNSGVRALEGKS